MKLRSLLAGAALAGLLSAPALAQSVRIVNPGTYQAGNAVATSTTSAQTMVASPGSGHTLYATAIVCGNSSATGTYVNLNDAHTLQFYVPPTFTGGIVMPLPSVIQWASNTAATFATVTSVNNVSCNFIGYSI